MKKGDDNIKLDMHVHSYYSDGVFSPREIVTMAKYKGLDGIALTDHDTIDGIDEILKFSDELEIIPGIEFSSSFKNEEVHILGYFIDYKSPDLIEFLEHLKSQRLNRTKEILKKLSSIDMPINENILKKQVKSNFIGRPHIARAMIAQGYVEDMSHAFNDFLIEGKPAYVERYKIKLEDAITIIHKLGGLAVLAHPGLLKDQSIVYDAIDLKIDGIECSHSKHKEEDILRFKEITKKYNLIETAGSDFHDLEFDEIILGDNYIEINNWDYFKRRSI